MSIRSYVAGPLLALSLASCATLGVDAGTIAQIQNAAVAACGFLPAASTIVNIIGTNSPGLQTAQAIAIAICQAMQPQTARGLIARTPTVAGVRVDGRFVR